MSGEVQLYSICALRVSRLDETGAPDFGNASGAWCATGIGSLAYSYEKLTGADIAETDGCGNLAAVRKYEDKIKRANLTLEFVTTDYRLGEILAEQPVLTSGDDVIGTVVQAKLGCGVVTARRGVVIEAWAEQYQCADIHPTAPYRRFVFPKAFMTPAGGTLQTGLNKIRFEGFSQANNNFFDGPFNDLDALNIEDTPSLTNWIEAELDDTTLPTCGTAEYLAIPAFSSSS